MNRFEDAARKAARAGKGGFRQNGPLSEMLVGRDPEVVRDRFGKPLQVGDLVLHRPVHDLVFQVVGIEPMPNVDPRRPGPAPIMVVLEIQVPLQVPPNQPIMNIVTIGHMEARAKEDGEEGKPEGPSTGGASEPGPNEPPMPDADQGGVGGDAEPPELPSEPVSEPVPSASDGSESPSGPSEPVAPVPPAVEAVEPSGTSTVHDPNAPTGTATTE